MSSELLMMQFLWYRWHGLKARPSTEPSHFIARQIRSRRLTHIVAAGLLLSCVAMSRGQDSAPPASPASLNYPTTAPNPPGPAVQINPVDESAQAYSPQQRRFQYGLLFRARGVYDDNINISHFNAISDYYFAIEPTITLGFGDIFERTENYLRLDYTPSVFLFLDHSEDDAVQHLIRLEGHHRFRRLDLTFAQSIQILDGADLAATTDTTITGTFANLDVSARTRVNIYATQVKAAYEITGKTSLSGGIDSTITDYPDLISSQVISGNLFVNYAYSDKLVVGIGGSGGYDFVDNPNPDQTFEQANVRLSYQATGKLSLNASGGVEFRQFEHSSRDTYISPVFEIDGTYQPFVATSFTLAMSRRTLNSAVLAGQDFASTTVSVGGRQRLFQRVYLALNVGYQNSDYFSTIDGVSADRSDDYYFVMPGLDVMITRFWSFGAYYLHRQDDSSVEFFSFDNNQVGVRTVLTF
jgi:hypothetical protein